MDGLRERKRKCDTKKKGMDSRLLNWSGLNVDRCEVLTIKQMEISLLTFLRIHACSDKKSTAYKESCDLLNPNGQKVSAHGER